MVKRIITALLALVLAVLLCSCARQMDNMGNTQAATRFSVVDEYARFQIIVDNDTGVMYAISENGTMTLLVNYDGSPRTYPAWDAKETRSP